MKKLHWQILKMLPGPFLGWLGTLMFLLLMQFLIRYLPDLVGKDLPLAVIAELVIYNLAYMVVLAVPMSVLIASLMGFGRLAETNAYLVIKSAGVSLPRLLWPTLAAGLVLTGCMWYFNNEVLPEANFRARNLWQDIRRKQPAFELKAGVFYDGLKGYSILVQHLEQGGNRLSDVLIYDYTDDSGRQAVIKAEAGRIVPVRGGSMIDLVLENGEVHRQPVAPDGSSADRYERLAFDRSRMRLDLSDFSFERSDPRQGSRSDRTMRTADMIRLVDSLEVILAQARRGVFLSARALAGDSGAYVPPADAPPRLPTPSTGPDAAPSTRLALVGLDEAQRQSVYDRALQHVRSARSEIEDVQRTVEWESQRADRYRVEIHKKYSIAVACLIFVLIGAPLGLSIRRGGLGTAGALAIGIFLFYWVTLVQGEKLADRNMLVPWFGMWIANIVMTAAGLYLVLYAWLDLGATPPLRKRLRRLVSERRLRRARPAEGLRPARPAARDNP